MEMPPPPSSKLLPPIRGMTPEREEKIPHSHEHPPHEERARLDLLRKDGDDPLTLTDHERSVGHIRPLWHSYVHITCGTINSFRFHDAVDSLARDPQRLVFRCKGAHCRCNNDFHPIVGDLRGRAPEFYWVDTAGVVTNVLVGS